MIILLSGYYCKEYYWKSENMFEKWVFVNFYGAHPNTDLILINFIGTDFSLSINRQNLTRNAFVCVLRGKSFDEISRRTT